MKTDGSMAFLGFLLGDTNACLVTSPMKSAWPNPPAPVDALAANLFQCGTIGSAPLSSGNLRSRYDI
jgi:hypothetical protein